MRQPVLMSWLSWQWEESPKHSPFGLYRQEPLSWQGRIPATADSSTDCQYGIHQIWSANLQDSEYADW